jgi:acetylornithine/succinyldiaminopimelate/putrescine aminotransferase
MQAQQSIAAKAAVQSPTRSLIDLLGKEYVQSVCSARASLDGRDPADLWAVAAEPVEFFAPSLQQRLDGLLDMVGQPACEPLLNSAAGAGTLAFRKATNTAMAPLAGLGFTRVGEDGKVYLTSKSEHYHASLGHSFPGYRLVDNARRLGIPQATHNNTRGHITRLLEEELVRVANGIERGDRASLQRVLASTEPHVLNRVVNIETGSLAVEAALKMMLARFYQLEDNFPAPTYAGRTPVFLVMADWQGGKKANYHGTTLFTQFMRGMWPDLYARLEESGIFVVKPVALNDSADFARLLETYEQPPYKVAGFFHEIVLMNYGAVRLEPDFLHRAYELCYSHDVPVMDDEIQSCIWSQDVFLYREYGLRPDFVSLGKGFPGGEYPASRMLTTAEMDNLHQFGALVTNGQEELASLSYLVTMEFVQANRDYIGAIGDYYWEQLQWLAARHPALIMRIEGYRHLASVFFYDTEKAIEFAGLLNQRGIDISAQTYKADCPPATLTKLPLIASYAMIDFLIETMDEVLRELE